MKTNLAGTAHRHPQGSLYGLRREANRWELTFEGRAASFKHELGALYVACLLGEAPNEPIHGVALALRARVRLGQAASPAEVLWERMMGLEEAASVRALWRRQRELDRVLADRLVIGPVKAEAQRELEEITEGLRQSPWLSRHGAERCARAVAVAIKRFHARLAAAVDAAGRPDVVLRRFAWHLHERLLVPSGRGGADTKAEAVVDFAGGFIYQPPRGVVWEVHGPKSKVQSPEAGGPGARGEGRGSECDGRQPSARRAGAVGYLSRFVCAACAVALMATGCAGPRPLKGGRAVITRRPTGAVEQALVQGENASQPTRQDQESVKVRTYTVPAGSRVEEAASGAGTARPHPSGSCDPSTLNAQPSTAFTLSAPMPVVEREETRARTELGAAQKDTARELGAKLASLKGIVWVGVGLFVFGLASLVWPPLKAVIASVTTSVALMLGGVALMILPSLIVGNELLLLGGVGVAVGGWFLAHRHGQLSGLVAALPGANGGKQ